MYYFEFGKKAYTEPLLTFGWSTPEVDFVWSEGNRSCVVLPTICPKQYHLSICIEPFAPLGRSSRFYVVVNSVNHGFFDLDAGKKVIDINVQEQLLPGFNGLTIDFFHLAANSPVEYGGTDDRRINIALRWISVNAQSAEHQQLIVEKIALSRSAVYEISQIQKKYKYETIEKNKINDDTSPHALTRAMQFFLYGYGGNNHDRRSLLTRIWEHGGRAPEDAELVTKWRLPHRLVERECPAFATFFLGARDMHDVDIISTHGERENALYDPNFADPWRGRFPSFFEKRVHAAQSIFKCKSADLLVNDRQYVIFDRDTLEFFPGGNPVGLSKLSIPTCIHETNQPTVVLQDQFDCANIAHFYFDSCLRAFQYCTFQPEARSTALFVLGGAPTEFHELALRALADIFGLAIEQFCFPKETVRIRSTDALYWFSDQAVDGHPAQNFRPESVNALQQIASRMLANISMPETSPKKIYISRSDASLRRLYNEDEVFHFLASIGFVKITMSELSWTQQIYTLANADIIVAPHGMALALLALNLRRPRVVELFNPLIGSECYALLSRAYGNDYSRLIGEEVDPQKRDFVVDIKDLKSLFV